MFSIDIKCRTGKKLLCGSHSGSKKGNYDKAKEKIKEGDESFVQGHTSHASLIQQEASGNPVQTTLLLVHSEDQLMSAETIKLMAEELIDCYKKMNSLK